MAFNYNGSKVSNTQPMAEINTTPLVDVMLVLLVIFIITAPLFQQAVPVDLPRVNANRLNEEPRIIRCAINAKGEVFVNDKPIAIESLEAALRSNLTAGAPIPELHLRADRDTRYERVTEVMAASQKLGITKIAFVTES